MADTISLGGYPTVYHRKHGSACVINVQTAQSARLTSHAHGFDRVHDGCDTWLECVEDEHTYIAGDRLPLLAVTLANLSSEIIVGFDYAFTHVTCGGGGIAVLTRSSPALSADIDASKWNLVAIPFILVSEEDD